MKRDMDLVRKIALELAEARGAPSDALAGPLEAPSAARLGAM